MAQVRDAVMGQRNGTWTGRRAVICALEVYGSVVGGVGAPPEVRRKAVGAHWSGGARGWGGGERKEKNDRIGARGRVPIGLAPQGAMAS